MTDYRVATLVREEAAERQLHVKALRSDVAGLTESLKQLRGQLGAANLNIQTVAKATANLALAIAPPDRTAGERLLRAAVCHALAVDIRPNGLNQDPVEIAKALWPEDETLATVTRAASRPASVTEVGWASEIVRATRLFVLQLAPLSAFAALSAASLALDVARGTAVRLPYRIATAADAGGWISEGQASPVMVLPFTAGPTLQAGTVRPLVAFSYELGQSGPANVEAVLRNLLSQETALLLDASMFSAAAATAANPSKGLFNGLTPLTASTATSRLDAMVADIEALVGALVAGGGGVDVAFVAAPAQFEALTILAGPEFHRRHLVLPSAALAPGEVCAIEKSALAITVGGASFDTSDEACLAMTNPGVPLIGATVPDDVAAPVSSYWQMGLTAVRLLLDAGWTIPSGLVAKVTGVAW